MYNVLVTFTLWPVHFCSCFFTI